MTVPIISPGQRLAEPRGARVLIVGPFGVGKTSLLRTLDPATTLFVDTHSGASRPNGRVTVVTMTTFSNPMPTKCQREKK
jgi:putative ribosome biogenesis GTPase RsgA